MRAHVQCVVGLLLVLGASGTARAQGWAPANLSASAASWDEVHLAWTDRSNNELEFRVERRAPGGSFAGVGVVPANVTAFADVGTLPSSAYEYRVVAVRSNTEGASGVVSVSTPGFLAPTPLTASAVGWDRVQVSWPAVTDAAVATRRYS